jgi:coiled-coil domain-containing protein 130
MQGFNMGRYVPPDLEGTASGNQLQRAMSSRRPRATPTVRFEMPFAVWCLTCARPTLIGQGVRFNAEKRATGAYHSTRIWTFRMRHADCGGAIEVRTDPQTTAYVVVAGARKHNVDEQGSSRLYYNDEDDGGGDDTTEGPHAVVTDAERDQLRRDAFANLEKTIEDREQLVAATRRVDELAALSARQWKDPDMRNKQLRDEFRKTRKRAERDAQADEALKDRFGIHVDLLSETEADARRAALADFGNGGGGHGKADDGRGYLESMSRPMFPTKRPFTPESKSESAAGGRGQLKAPVGKAASAAARARQNLASEVLRNSRTAKDPFLSASDAPPRPKKIKRGDDVMSLDDSNEMEPPHTRIPIDNMPAAAIQKGVPTLVDYDSDS